MQDEIIAGIIANRFKRRKECIQLEKEVGRPIHDYQDLYDIVCDIMEQKNNPLTFLWAVLPTSDIPFRESRIVAVVQDKEKEVIKITHPASFVKEMGVGLVGKQGLRHAIDKFRKRPESVDICMF